MELNANLRSKVVEFENSGIQIEEFIGRLELILGGIRSRPPTCWFQLVDSRQFRMLHQID